MMKKLQRSLQILSILPVLGRARLLAAMGKSDVALRLLGKTINSQTWKTRSFANYEPTSQDVFVATYAKSGTNWMMQIAQQIAYYGAAEFNHIHDIVPWPDVPFPKIRAKLEDPSIAERAPSGLRVIKTHFDRGFVPFNDQAKYIIVIRDPKEIVVSGYHFAAPVCRPLGIQYNVEQWLDAVQSDDFMFGDWAMHTKGWWEVRDRPNVQVYTFKELKKNTAHIIKQIAQVLDVKLSEEQIETVVGKSSFAWMKAHESQFSALKLPDHRRGESPVMMRSGKSGKTSELLSAKQQSLLDQYFTTKLKQLNSDFPYDELFIGSGLA